jgi:hypothetical protein
MISLFQGYISDNTPCSLLERGGCHLGFLPLNKRGQGVFPLKISEFLSDFCFVCTKSCNISDIIMEQSILMIFCDSVIEDNINKEY